MSYEISVGHAVVLSSPVQQLIQNEGINEGFDNFLCRRIHSIKTKSAVPPAKIEVSYNNKYL